MMDFWQVGLPESGNGGISWPNFALPRQTSLAASIPKPGQPQTSQSQSLCQPHFAGSAGFLLLLLSLIWPPFDLMNLMDLFWVMLRPNWIQLIHDFQIMGHPVRGCEGCMPLFHTVPVLVSFLFVPGRSKLPWLRTLCLGSESLKPTRHGSQGCVQVRITTKSHQFCFGQCMYVCIYMFLYIY
jgi:hypothetical protein